MGKIVLVRPPVNVLHKFSKPVECLALGYLASALRTHHHNVVMLDGMLFDWPLEELITRILKEKPDVVGFTNVLNYFPQETRDQISKLRTLFKGLIVLGGHSVSFFPEEILNSLPELDAVILGEAEYSFPQLVNCYLNKESFNKVNGIVYREKNRLAKTLPKRVLDLNKIPPPARDLVPQIISRDGLICISTSRGCFARCSFCSIPRFYGLCKGKKMHTGDWLCRDVDLVVEEIASLYKNFRLMELLVVDDEFFGGSEAGKHRARLLGKKLKALNIPLKFTISCRAENVDYDTLLSLKEGGLTHVFVGIESGLQDDLKLLTKGHSPKQNKEAIQVIKSLGLTFQAGFMMFNHRSTLHQLKNNINFLKEVEELKPVIINSAVEPHFGAPLTNLMDREDSVVYKDHEIAAAFKDLNIAVMKKIAEKCAGAFEPYMNFIAGINSAVTYEWRRTVPGRLENNQKLINKLEKLINDQFASVFEEALDLLIKNETYDHNLLLSLVDSRIKEINETLKISQAIVLNEINKSEKDIKYWSQKEYIEYFQNTRHEKSSAIT
jgi:anaerobic magnesium-protoporphyrin IX monomethyl ester cyclase